MGKYIKEHKIARFSFIAISALVGALGIMVILFATVGIFVAGETHNWSGLWVDIIVVMTLGWVTFISGGVATYKLMALGGKG